MGQHYLDLGQASQGLITVLPLAVLKPEGNRYDHAWTKQSEVSNLLAPGGLCGDVCAAVLAIRGSVPTLGDNPLFRVILDIATDSAVRVGYTAHELIHQFQ